MSLSSPLLTALLALVMSLAGLSGPRAEAAPTTPAEASPARPGPAALAPALGANSGACEVPAHCAAGAVCVGGVCLTGSDRARVEVLYPIAVPEPLAVGGSPRLAADATRLGELLRRHLAWTGFYKVLGPGQLPELGALEGVSPAETRRQMWHVAGAYRVLRASLVPTDEPGAWRMVIRLTDIEDYGTIDLPEGDVLVRPGGLRHAAARWVDALVGLDTGLRGSVDSQLVASVQVAPGVKEVAIVDTDGTLQGYVTANGSLNLSPAWGPDRSIGYMSYRSGNPDWIVDGHPLSTRPGLNAAGAWSPDGQLLALSVAEADNSDIVLLRADTGEEHARLTNHPAADTSPVWSPDGSRIAFVSDRTGSPQIWLASLNGEELRRLTSGGYNTSPAWSPLGDTIVYAQQLGSSGFALIRHDLDRGRTARISPTGASAESPAFSPDGRYIAYVRRDGGGQSSLWRMRVDGSEPRPLGGGLSAGPMSMFAPDWEPRAPSPLAAPEPNP